MADPPPLPIQTGPTVISYDAADQLLSLTYANGSTTVASAAYQYNVTGTRSSEAREDGNTRTFGYDQVDRVLSSVNSTLPPTRNETFAYDLEGNWTTNARVYDAADELAQDANYDYSYDAEGNLAQKTNRTNPADQTNYTYDAQNRLVQLVSPLGTSVYAYDALGRRIARAVNGTTTRYILDEQNVRLELDGSNALSAANTHAALDRLLVRDQTGGPLFYQSDGLGSITALTDATGAVVERYRYSAFGRLEVLDANFQPVTINQPRTPYTYAGREWEPEAALYFNRARFYDPSLGRFISRDPIGEAGGLNLYGYVFNNPVNLNDPLGLEPPGYIPPGNQPGPGPAGGPVAPLPEVPGALAPDLPQNPAQAAAGAPGMLLYYLNWLQMTGYLHSDPGPFQITNWNNARPTPTPSPSPSPNPNPIPIPIWCP